jgi:hypothetical protein
VFPYQNRLDCWGEKGDGEEDTYYRVNWQILNLASNFVNLLVGKLMKVQYEPECVILDPEALDAKEQKTYLLRAHMELKEWAAQIGVGIDPARFGIDPSLLQDSDEAEMHMNMNYKDRMALEAEMAISLHLTRNNFQQIRKEYLQDAVIYGVLGVECKNDPLGNTKISRESPERIVTAYSPTEDNSKINYSGYIDNYTFEELRQLAQTDFNEEQYEDIWKNHCSYMIPAENQLQPFFGIPFEAYANRSREKVCRVFKFYFLTTIEDTYESKKDKLGNKKIYKSKPERGMSQEYQDKYVATGEREILKDNYQVCYEGYMIVGGGTGSDVLMGTEYIFGYKQVVDMEVAKNNLSTTQIPLRVFAPNMMDGKVTSIIESCLPVFDEIQINWLQFQHCIASYIPDGLAIDMSAMIDGPIGKGGKAMTPRQVLDLVYKKGTMVYNGKNLAGYTNNNGKTPITPMKFSDLSVAERFLQNIQSMLGILNRIIGTNDFTNAATPSPEALNGVGQMAIQGTEDALFYLYNADRMIHKKVYESLVLLTQNAVRRGVKVNGNVDGISTALGASSLRFWEVNSDISYVAIGIDVKAAPTQAEWQQFMTDLSGAVESGALSVGDKIAIQECHNLRQARQMMLVRERRNKQQAQQQTMQLNDQQAQNNQALATAAEKEKQNTIQLEGQVKLQTELAILEKQKELILLKGDIDLRIETTKLQAQTAHVAMNIEGKVASQVVDHHSKKDLKQLEIDNQKPVLTE